MADWFNSGSSGNFSDLFLKQVNASNLAVSAVVPVFMFFNSVPCILWGQLYILTEYEKGSLFILYMDYSSISGYLLSFGQYEGSGFTLYLVCFYC